MPDALHEKLLLLDRLIDLLEEMEELGISGSEQLVAWIDALEREIDDAEEESDAGR